MTTPPFVHRLLGRRGAFPNMADKSSDQSVAIAAKALDLLGIAGTGATAGQSAGTILEDGVLDFLAAELPARDPSRTWLVDRRLLVKDFEQYEHLGRLHQMVLDNPTLRNEIGQDYLVRPDVTVGIDVGGEFPVLHAAVSCKFTIRSDRVQNIRHEGIILTRHRRGRQPHVVTVTTEPLPSRLAAIARGTGEVDAVYHVFYDELVAAAEVVGSPEQRDILYELTEQRRLFPMEELVRSLTV